MNALLSEMFLFWFRVACELIKQGCLYCIYVRSVDGSSLLQFVVSKSTRVTILKDMHEGVMHGNLGEAKTLECVREQLHWPTYHSNVCNWPRTCRSCAARKTSAVLDK